MSKQIITAQDAKKFQERKLEFLKIKSQFDYVVSKTNEIENAVVRNLMKACLVPLGILMKYVGNEFKREENKL